MSSEVMTWVAAFVVARFSLFLETDVTSMLMFIASSRLRSAMSSFDLSLSCANAGTVVRQHATRTVGSWDLMCTAVCEEGGTVQGVESLK
jgi:hypothetical protein